MDLKTKQLNHKINKPTEDLDGVSKVHFDVGVKSQRLVVEAHIEILHHASHHDNCDLPNV